MPGAPSCLLLYWGKRAAFHSRRFLQGVLSCLRVGSGLQLVRVWADPSGLRSCGQLFVASVLIMETTRAVALFLWPEGGPVDETKQEPVWPSQGQTPLASPPCPRLLFVEKL